MNTLRKGVVTSSVTNVVINAESIALKYMEKPSLRRLFY